MENGFGIALIDMQRPYLANHSLSSLKSMITAQKNVLRYSMQNNVPVFSFEFSGREGTFNGLYSLLSSYQKNFRFVKNKRNGFGYEEVHKKAADLGISNFYVMGVHKSFCVKETARGALEHGFSIYASPEVISDPDGIPHEMSRFSDEWFSQNGVYMADYFGVQELSRPSFNEEKCIENLVK